MNVCYIGPGGCCVGVLWGSVFQYMSARKMTKQMQSVSLSICLQKRDVGGPSPVHTAFPLTQFAVVGGTQEETPHYHSSAGIASVICQGKVWYWGTERHGGEKNIIDMFHVTHEFFFFLSNIFL